MYFLYKSGTSLFEVSTGRLEQPITCVLKVEGCDYRYFKHESSKERAMRSPKRPRPPKPPDRPQGPKTPRPAGKSEWVRAHWRYDYIHSQWEWVSGHWRK